MLRATASSLAAKNNAIAIAHFAFANNTEAEMIGLACICNLYVLLCTPCLMKVFKWPIPI